MSFELREHTADVAVAATGETLETVFAAVADGLATACCEDWPAAGERDTLAVTAENREALLFEYCDELIYRRDVTETLPVDNRVDRVERRDGEWHLEASARWLPAEGLGAREVKAVTYSEMELIEGDDDWEAYVVFDV